MHAIRLFSATFVLLTLVGAALHASQPAAGAEPANEVMPIRPATYLSLGDSLASGEGARQPKMEGYAALVQAAREAAGSGGASLPDNFINLGRTGGETTAWMRQKGQLDVALAEIGLRRQSPTPIDDVALITLSVGGNDVFPVLQVCAGATAPVDPSSACARSVRQAFADFGPTIRRLLVP